MMLNVIQYKRFVLLYLTTGISSFKSNHMKQQLHPSEARYEVRSDASPMHSRLRQTRSQYNLNNTPILFILFKSDVVIKVKM